jgi:hypothetical protein
MRGIRLFKILIVAALFGFQVQAQTNKSASAATSKSTKVLGSQLTTILQFGLAGGALGLSTLSFYGRPQDKLAHIPVGMAIGIITGAIVSTSQMVAVPQDVTAQMDTGVFREPLPSPDLQWTISF